MGENYYRLIHRSDIASFCTDCIIWVNGTQPLAFSLNDHTDGLGTPKSPFPFARLASVTSQSMTYLYHQINSTKFAEERWDGIEGYWGTPEYFQAES